MCQSPSYEAMLQERQRTAAIIEQHFKTFQNLLSLVDAFVKKGSYEAAAVCAQIAAYYAFRNHTGLFSSTRLEHILLAIGRQTAEPQPPTGASSHRRSLTTPHRRILHVLTQAYATGGHTRFVSRWIAEDAARVHSIALTAQGNLNVPDELVDRVSRSGGSVTRTSQTTLLGRARSLRALVADADCVVLHSHPHDVVPVIALADKPSPPVIFLNHADHVFWVGTGASNVIANIRRTGELLSRQRRGIPEECSSILPIPVERPQDNISRVNAKRQLGLDDESIVILSVAPFFKYAAVDGMDLPGVLAPVLEGHNAAVLIVIGPSNESSWKALSDAMPGRIRVLGERVHDELAPFFQAADIYVDSFPLASLTSLLEAGAHGVPLLSFCQYPQAAHGFCADSPGLGASLIRVTSINECRAVLSGLIEDAGQRLSWGEKARHEIWAAHTGDGWRAGLEEVYARARTFAAWQELQIERDTGLAGDLDLLMAQGQLRLRASTGVKGAIRAERSLLRRLPSTLRAWGWMTALTLNSAFAFELLGAGWFHFGLRDRHPRSGGLRRHSDAALRAIRVFHKTLTRLGGPHRHRAGRRRGDYRPMH